MSNLLEVDLRLRQAVSQTGTPIARVENLLDLSQEHLPGKPLPGRAVYIGFEQIFSPPWNLVMKQKFWMILLSVLLLLVLIFLIRERITLHAHPHAHGHDHSHDQAGPVLSPDEVLDLDGLERFHGHLGPYLVLGARAVQVGSSSLGVPATQLNTVLSCNLQSPERCMVDAVQFYSDATFGRGRLAVLSAPSPMMHVIDRQTGNTAILMPSPIANEILSRLPAYSGPGTSSDQAIADLAREAAQLPGKALWDVVLLKESVNGPAL